jgi:hypothetical protein
MGNTPFLGHEPLMSSMKLLNNPDRSIGHNPAHVKMPVDSTLQAIAQHLSGYNDFFML